MSGGFWPVFLIALVFALTIRCPSFEVRLYVGDQLPPVVPIFPRCLAENRHGGSLEEINTTAAKVRFNPVTTFRASVQIGTSANPAYSRPWSHFRPARHRGPPSAVVREPHIRPPARLPERPRTGRFGDRLLPAPLSRPIPGYPPETDPPGAPSFPVTRP